MLTSDLDSEPDTDKKKPKKYRPQASGPSVQRQLANKCSKLSRTDLGVNPTHSYKYLVKTNTETTNNPLPVETDLSVDTESAPVETTNSLEHVETNESTSHVETGSPKKGTLVTRSFELKKYKRP